MGQRGRGAWQALQQIWRQAKPMVLYIHYLSKVPASLLKPVSHATCSPEPSFCQLTPEAGVQEVLGIVKIA